MERLRFSRRYVHMKTWKKHQRPDLQVCPQSFCFFWEEVGDQVAPGFYPSVAEATRHLVAVTTSGCGFRYGQCRRECSLEGIASPSPEAKDFYEPCEPRLAKADLPDFYFNDPTKIRDEETKAEYARYFGEER